MARWISKIKKDFGKIARLSAMRPGARHVASAGVGAGIDDLPALAGLGAALVDKIRGEFDAEFYLERYEDVRKAGVDPFRHYLTYGWSENRDPSREFSTAFYSEQSPDVLAAGINPFVHWVLNGRDEGRMSKRPGGVKYDMLLRQRSLSEMAEEWRRKDAPPVLALADEIVQLINLANFAKHDRMLLSIGHDHYRQVSGGVQFTLQREENLSSGNGRLYVNLHPWGPRPCLAAEGEDILLQVVANGRDVAVIAMSEWVLAMRRLSNMFEACDIVIHHLMGHSPEGVAEMISAAGQTSCFVWVHDFFTVCPSYALQRNNVAFCGAPDIDSNACGICLYGAERRDHQRRMKRFFDLVAVNLIAPSQAALDLWLERSGLQAASVQVVPHADLSQTSVTRQRKDNAPAVRVAFVGFPALHKGWQEFVALAAAFRQDPKFEFYYFGSQKPPASGLRFVPVSVSAETPNAMVDALAENEIDLVIHWASCFETFSFSTIEAISSGAFVVTNPASGNVAALVKVTNAGVVLSDMADLKAFFVDGRLDALVTRRRLAHKVHAWNATPSALTYALLGVNA